MAVITHTPDYFLIGQTNTISDGYLKNGTNKLGGYQSRSSYSWESIFKTDLSSIAAGSTIDTVTIEVTVSTNNNVGDANISVREQDKITWTDNGSTTPEYNTFTDTAWNTVLSSIVLPGLTTGVYTIPTSAGLVAQIQDMVDEIIDVNKGLVVTNYTEYYDYYSTITSVSYTINYTPGSTARRRIMIIS